MKVGPMRGTSSEPHVSAIQWTMPLMKSANKMPTMAPSHKRYYQKKFLGAETRSRDRHHGAAEMWRRQCSTARVNPKRERGETIRIKIFI